MNKHKQNSRTPVMVIIVALLVFMGAFMSVFPEKNINAAADTTIVDDSFFSPLADEKTEVFISLASDYQLSYKGTSYIRNISGAYYTDEGLFSVLEFEDISSTPINDLTANDIVVTGVTEIKNYGTYNVTFSISDANASYFGTIATSVDISKKSLSVTLGVAPKIYYGQTLADLALVYTGFVTGESATSLVSLGTLTHPTINNINATTLDPINNGSIDIQLNNDGTADNYSLIFDTVPKSLTIQKARVRISLDSNTLPYAYMDYINGGNPLQQLFDIMSFTNTDIAQPITSNIARTDVVIVSPYVVRNAKGYQLNVTINSANIYYTISSSQELLPLTIAKAVFDGIDDTNITTYFSYNPNKLYDATTDMAITVIQTLVSGINGENIEITGVSSDYSSKDTGTRSFSVTYTLNSTNYTVTPIVMDGANAGTISAYAVPGMEPLRFVGAKLQKEYDTTTDMQLYDKVYFIRTTYISVYNFLAQKLQTEYGLNLSDAQQLVSFLSCFVGDESTDEYIVLRLDYYDTLNMLYGFLSNAQTAQTAVDGLFANMTGWLSSQYTVDSYSGAEIGDLYFTEFNELIKLSNGTLHIVGQYNSKDAITEFVTEIGYNIDYNGFSHTNYTLPGTDIDGVGGIIINATIGVAYPTIQKIYGQPNPTDIYVPFFDIADLETILGTTISPDGNAVFLPIAARSALSLTEFMYFNRVLTGFYDSDLTDPEVDEMLDAGSLYYIFPEDSTAYNVYAGYADYLIDKKARYNLEAIMPIKNYNFLAILNLYDSSYYSSPGLQVNPVDTVINNVDIDYSKVYSKDADTDFSDVAIDVTTSSFIAEEQGLFYLDFSAHFIDLLGNKINDVASSLQIGDFNFEVKYFPDYSVYNESQLQLMACNYKINRQSFCDKIDAYVDVSLEVFISTENIWVSYYDYKSTYSSRDILDCRISEVTVGTIAITPAQLLIRIASGQQFDYGNDILSSLNIVYENFYQNNPEAVFDIIYLIKTLLGQSISHEENNSLPTPLLPSDDHYNITLTDFSIVDTVWQSIFGGNYNISIDTSAVDFHINKPTLEYSIANKIKTFGDFDPVFSFNSIVGARDSDLAALDALLHRTAATQSNENVGTQVIIELQPHAYYNYAPSTGSLNIIRKTIDIVPNSFEVEYGAANSSTYRFTITKNYTAYTPRNPEGIELLMYYDCSVSTLDAGAYYIHDIVSSTIDNSDANKNNFTVNLSNGSDKIRIIPKNVTVDLSSLGAVLSKVYDESVLSFSLKNNAYDYYNNLQGLLTPEQIEEVSEYVDLASQFAYQESIFYASIGGYNSLISDTMLDQTKVGSKVLFFDLMYLAKRNQNYDVVLCNVDNYQFNIVTTGNITPKAIRIDTTPADEVYKKTYDGEALEVAYKPSMQAGLVSGQYFKTDSLWFATAETRASATAHSLHLEQQASGFVVYDAEGNEVQNNYVISTTDFGGGTIEARKIKASLAGDINHIYDSYKIYIDLANGNVYKTKSGSSELLTNRTIIFEYDISNTNTNTIATVFVGTHAISAGKLISPSASATRQALVLHEDLVFSGSETINYQILFASNFWVNIAQRPIVIDVNPEEQTLSKTYDGTAYSVELNNSMANNLISLHTLSGARRTFDGNVNNEGGTVQPKELISSFNVAIIDENTQNVFSNYIFTYVERYATIYRREMNADITLDASVSKTKVFNDALFTIQLTEPMMTNLAVGDSLSGGVLSTLDANVYTLDIEGNIIYDGEDYAAKIMQVAQNITIMRGGTDTTANYNISLINNFVTITQKPLSVDMRRDYSYSDFTYQGSPYEFAVTNNMITGLLFGHSVMGYSSPLISDGENVGNNIDIIFPAGEVYIQDEIFTHNYSFNFQPFQINIIKRNVEIDVSSTGLELSKVYDAQIFSADLTEQMDTTAGEPARGLVMNHTFVGTAKTLNDFAASSKPLNFVCLAISDADGIADYIGNYNIIYTNVTVRIEKRDLSIDINATYPEGHSIVYNDTQLTVNIIPQMLSGLQGVDYLVDSGVDRSFRRTVGNSAGSYSLDTQGEGEIIILREGLSENLATNYNFKYVSQGLVQILPRRISVTVRNSEDYYTDGDGAFVSGLRAVYSDSFYTVDHTFYQIDNADGNNQNFGFELVSGHAFSFGSRITSEKIATSKTLLIHNQRTEIRNSAHIEVTSNYEVIFLDSYYEIYKRKILLDPAKNIQGETTEYDSLGSFQKRYDRKLFEIAIVNSMVTEQGEYPVIVAGHSINDGFLISADAAVARNIDYNVIPKQLIWDTNRPLVILDASLNNVTVNYEIDSVDTVENFVERVVTILPQTLLINIKEGVQSPIYTKPYDGTPYVVNIINGMVVEDIAGAGGFVGDLREGGGYINKDRIRIGSGNLVTADADVSYDALNNIDDKVLGVGQSIIIENPSLADVTSNYNIYYCKDVKTVEDWQAFLQGETNEKYSYYQPKVRITQKDLVLALSDAAKIQKYYDALPFDISFSFINGVFEYEGTVINNNLQELLSLTGLVQNEYAEFRFVTTDGEVGAQKQWFYDPTEIVILKDGTVDGSKNYRAWVQINTMGQILPRQICVDVNAGGTIAEHVYSGAYYVVDITASMVRQTKENNAVITNLTDSLGLMAGNTIVGSRRSVSASAGTQNLIPNNPIRILNDSGIDITNQFLIYEYTNQKVNILPAELIIDLTNSAVPTTKVYDGLRFEINLSEPGIVGGLKLASHYVSFGKIVTPDKNAATNKPALCDITEVRIKQIVEGEGSVDLDVTYNYTFTYIETPLTITQKGITIKAGAEFYKPYNETTVVTLRSKHYSFNVGDICAGDTVLLNSYTAAFASAEAGSSGENITVTAPVIDNGNYYLLNNSFIIVGRIVNVSPSVEVSNSLQIDGTDGVKFSYDGQPKSATLSITGLEGDDVAHEVKYQLPNAAEGDYLSAAPTNAGKYKMHVITRGIDENYPNWPGALIIIVIEPANVAVSFTGSLNQQYGEVSAITAKAIGAGGLNENIELQYTPIHAGYVYPGAGEYQITAEYNTDKEFVNYMSASETRLLTIHKRNIEIIYGNTDSLVYNGSARSIPVSIKAEQILPADSGVVTNALLNVTYGGDYSNVRLAGNYTMTVAIQNPNYNITNNKKNFTIQKTSMTIRALVNGSARISLNEGDAFVVTLEYEGFVSGESRIHLIKPAQLPYVPKTAVNELSILPSGAGSLNYVFTYIPAYLTIIERKVALVEDANGMAAVTGEYGSYVSLSATSINADISNPDFYLINENIKKNFSSNRVLDEYKVHMAYRLSLAAESDEAQEISTIKLKLSDDLKRYESFVVLHFDEKGIYEMVGAFREGDYIVLSADSVGDFVIMTPRTGLSPNLIILLFLAPIALFVIIIMFYIIFRRKYDAD